MRRGTSALGADVPSEKEINRLAARSEEEFWLFEKMDEERRQRENYRSRLMEEHEVPDWVYTIPDIKGGKSKGSLHDDTPVTGKRLRKEVIREDTISDSQWKKAVENGDDVSNKNPGKRRRENNPPPIVNNESLPKVNVVEEKKAAELKSETVSVASEAKSEDTSYGRSKSEAESSQRSGFDGLESGLNGLTWRSHKRKRSSLT